MYESLNAVSAAVMQERFGHDNLFALATVDETGATHVRTVNGYYENGSIYVVTNACSGKMKQLSRDSRCAVAGDWFTANGQGENLGWICLPEHKALADRIRAAFTEWYANGHTDESDENTVILRIRLTDGILFHHGTRYEILFS